MPLREHICKESHTCCCSSMALEPAERCPTHGCGDWPPRCGVCGKFLPHISRQRAFYKVVTGTQQEENKI